MRQTELQMLQLGLNKALAAAPLQTTVSTLELDMAYIDYGDHLAQDATDPRKPLTLNPFFASGLLWVLAQSTGLQCYWLDSNPKP